MRSLSGTIPTLVIGAALGCTANVEPSSSSQSDRAELPASALDSKELATVVLPDLDCGALLPATELNEVCGHEMTLKSQVLEGKTALTLCAREFRKDGVSDVLFSVIDRGEGTTATLPPAPKGSFEPTPIEGLGDEGLFYSVHRGPKTALAVLHVAKGRYILVFKQRLRKKSSEQPRDALACERDQIVTIAKGVVSRL